ncbi:MAG: TolC family protein [Armatimonadota bacterium]|nr:TolC family protein [Armatimonadota bacterium]
MFRQLITFMLLALCWTAIVTAQEAPSTAPPESEQQTAPLDTDEPTPPIAPKTQAIPLPPAVELPPPPTPSEIPSAPLTADEAARIALRLQPDVTVAGAGITAAQGRTQQTRAGLRPTLGVGTSYTRSERISGSGSSGSVNDGVNGTTSGSSSGVRASATVQQLLFDFNRTRDLVRQAVAQERAAGANLTRVQADLVLQVKQAFYTYVQNVRLVGVNETNLRNRQEQLALAQARLNAGLGLPADVVRAQTAVAEAVFNLDLARNNASTSRVNLALLMGIDPRTPLQAADSGEPAVTTDNVNALVDSALAQRPEVLQAQATLQAAGFGLNAAKNTNAPSLSANVGVTARGNKLLPRNSSLNAGVVLQWSPFDGGLTAGRVREARADVTTAQAQLNDVRLNVVSDVSQAYLNLRTAEQRVVTAEAQIVNAEESVRLAQGRYRAGLGTFIDVIDAQAALLTARTNRVNALSAVDQARAALARAIGAPIPAPAQ